MLKGHYVHIRTCIESCFSNLQEFPSKIRWAYPVEKKKTDWLKPFHHLTPWVNYQNVVLDVTLAGALCISGV